jgi:hypothetical protein
VAEDPPTPVRGVDRGQRPREQRFAHRSEESSRAEARLVHSSSPGNHAIKARPCNLQPGDRQQASRLRPGQTAPGRHLLGSQCAASSTIAQSKSKCLLPSTLSSLPNAHSRQTNVGGKPPLRPPEGSRRQAGISRVTCCLLLNIARAF